VFVPMMQRTEPSHHERLAVVLMMSVGSPVAAGEFTRPACHPATLDLVTNTTSSRAPDAINGVVDTAILGGAHEFTDALRVPLVPSIPSGVQQWLLAGLAVRAHAEPMPSVFGESVEGQHLLTLGAPFRGHAPLCPKET
jgi:hypothetical protein